VPEDMIVIPSVTVLFAASFRNMNVPIPACLSARTGNCLMQSTGFQTPQLLSKRRRLKNRMPIGDALLYGDCIVLNAQKRMWIPFSQIYLSRDANSCLRERSSMENLIFWCWRQLLYCWRLHCVQLGRPNYFDEGPNNYCLLVRWPHV